MSRLILSCFSASLFSFYNLFIFSMMNVISIYLIHDFKFTPSQLGFLGSFDLWGNVLGFIPIGILLDRYNVRKIGLPLFALAIISTLLMAYANNFYLFSALRFLQGIASAGSLLITMRVGVSFGKHSNKVIGFMIFIALSGGLLGNSGFSAIATYMGWRNDLKLMAFLGVICFLVMWLLLINTKQVATTSQFSLKKLLSKYSLWAGCQIGLLNSPVFILGSLFGNQFLLQQSSLTINQSAFISSLLFIGIMLTSPISGYLADKMSSLKIINIAYLGLFIACCLLTLKLNLGFIAYSILFFLIGCFCCTQNLIYPLLYRKHADFPSTTTAISALIFNCFGALLQIIFGLLLEFMTGSINLALLFFPILFVAGMMHLYRYKS